jgi:hypothetical protein
MDTPELPPPEGEPTAEPEEPVVPQFTPADEEDLQTDVHMEGDQAIGTLVAKGKHFKPNRADALSLSELIRTFANALYKIALERRKVGDWVVPTAIDKFEFASAHIRFIAGEGETLRMDEGGSPTVEAAKQVTALMQVEGDELLRLAQEAGPEGARAYKQFVRAVNQAEDAEVAWKDSDAIEPVTIDSVRAGAAFQVLDREGLPASETLEAIPGHLSMADASLHRFKLNLPPSGDFARPTALKGKRTITGQYDSPVGESVKSKGLWDRDVIATIRVEREEEASVAAPRDPQFHLVAVEAVAEVSAAQNDEPDEEIAGTMTLDGEDG